MSNETPAILLMFANQQDAHLQMLKEESKKIDRVLSRHDDKGTIKVFREESATVDDLNNALSRFENRVAIFHYAGHADGGSLRFEKGDGYATGIAELLGRLPNLKLVFLNGCSTQEQVDYLLENGVKAVIATAVPINDEKAVLFAENFYRSLSNFHSIESAFRRTVSLMKTIYGGAFEATVVQRGDAAIFADKEKMPWGLFVNKDGEEALSWEIPTFYKVKQEKKTEIEGFQVNQELELVIEELIKVNPALEQLCTIDGIRDSRAALLQIIQNYPWPIATQIRLLVAKDGDIDRPSVERIKQIVSVYICVSKFLFYTMISQLWNEKRQASFAAKNYLIDMLYVNAKQHSQFDYFRNFVEAVKLLKEANCQLFIPEFEQVMEDFEARKELYEAYEYLEALRSAINTNKIEELEDNLVQKAADGEYHLSTILIEIAFMIQYSLITIRDIHVINPRYLDTQFNHFMRRLNVSVGNIAVSGEAFKMRTRSFQEFTNNASVILTPDVQNPKAYLNLSPFIIDINSFKQGMTEDRATEQQLFMYAHRVGEDEVQDYKYYSTFHSIFVAKEREADQFILKANKDDNHTSGRAGRSNRRRRRRRRRNTRKEEPQLNPFEVLKKQFEILEKDLLR